MKELRFPYQNTLEESLEALRKQQPISSLTFKFEDDVFGVSENLQKEILANKTSGTVECLKIRNFCTDPQKHNQCFNFYLRCLEGPVNETKIFFYCGFFPLSLTDAENFANAIVSNGDIKALSLMGGKQGLFREEGTFECVFDAILNKGAVRGLQLTLLSFNDIVQRGCTSNLASNTTLKELELNIIQPDASQVADEGMKELSKILRVNTGLEKIDICRGMMTNIGRKYLLESLEDNLTLVKLDTRRLPLLIDPFQQEEKEEFQEGISLQCRINRHMEWNKIYQRSMNPPTTKTLSKEIYPALLEALANKPSALFSFLRKHNPSILTSRRPKRKRKEVQQRPSKVPRRDTGDARL